MKNQVGKTQDVGFQFGIRKTFSVQRQKAWDFQFSEKGLKIWLGKLKNELEIKKEYETENGITGLVLVFKANSHIRLNWKPKHWENMSTVQIRVTENQEKSIIGIHQEKLLNSEQRAEMKEYWTKIIERIRSEIEKPVHNKQDAKWVVKKHLTKKLFLHRSKSIVKNLFFLAASILRQAKYTC